MWKKSSSANDKICELLCLCYIKTFIDSFVSVFKDENPIRKFQNIIDTRNADNNIRKMKNYIFTKLFILFILILLNSQIKN